MSTNRCVTIVAVAKPGERLHLLAGDPPKLLVVHPDRPPKLVTFDPYREEIVKPERGTP